MAATPPSTPLPPLAVVEFRSRQQSDRGSIYRVYTRRDKSIPDRSITTRRSGRVKQRSNLACGYRGANYYSDINIRQVVQTSGHTTNEKRYNVLTAITVGPPRNYYDPLALDGTIVLKYMLKENFEEERRATSLPGTIL
ncbi:hypothetical protein UY3_04103 [Chelonia mydas]|uniref:Uncharacterized protein n=1 Tax=Chelonia mydas TaxID=8469 RepID=M7BNI2_CHEMY|nr:hypothetical protein UY3_04103 [Chelonia mydas]